MITVHLVRGQEDWEGLYIDGVLVTEDHSLSGAAVLSILAMQQQGIKVFISLVLNDRAEATLLVLGSLPKTIDEVMAWMGAAPKAGGPYR
jgi:hypothetical protein